MKTKVAAASKIQSLQDRLARPLPLRILRTADPMLIRRQCRLLAPRHELNSQ